jgi:hypothetical protein
MPKEKKYPEKIHPNVSISTPISHKYRSELGPIAEESVRSLAWPYYLKSEMSRRI